MYAKYMKRLFDIIFSIFAFVALSPIILAIAVVVRIKLGSPVIFKQQRPGKGEKIFTIYKFRTMTEGRNDDGKLLPDDIRLTKFGKWLRSTSLDELPELWNIIKGDMSLVGPRPLLVEYLPYYTEEERKRHSVRPGLTGLAQINGRNTLTWEEKFRYDIEYVCTYNVPIDVKISLLTILRVIKREGVSISGSVILRKLDVERNKLYR